MKRLIALALVAFMLITMVPLAALSVFAVGGSLQGLVGAEPSNPMVKTVFYSDGYVPGGKLTVKITVSALNQAGVIGYEADSLIYDSSKLTLVNAKNSRGIVDCITASPGKEWMSENLTTANVDGEIVLSAIGGVWDSKQILTSYNFLEFTLEFDVAEDVSGDLVIYIPHSAISTAEAGTFAGGSGLGGYMLIPENTSGDASEDESEDVSKDVSKDESEDASEDVSDETYIPSDKEDDILALMGDAPSDPLAKVEISAPRYIDGEILEVAVSVYDIIEGGLNGLSIKNFTYDATKLTLLNKINSDGAIECITECPGSDWIYDNFCKFESEGVLMLASIGGVMDDSQLLTSDYGLVFTLRFKVISGTTEELVFYAPHEYVSASKAYDFLPMPCESDYLIVHHKCALGHTENGEADCENDQICTVCGDVLTPAIGHDYDSVVTEPDYKNGGYTTHTCVNCGDSYVDSETSPLELPALAFSGATLTLQDDLTINYKANESLFSEVGYSNPYVIFVLNGVETKVTDYTVENGKYIFDFENIIPHQMNDTIYATLYATFDGEEYSSATREYSVATYCYNILNKYNTPAYAELLTLLVDLLNYGSASQIYMNYNTDALVNANLTEAQKEWGTSEDRELVTVQNLAYEKIENPTVSWKGGGLNLQKSVSMRFKIDATDITNLTVKVTNDKGGEAILTPDTFEATTGGYYVYFKDFNAGQMSEVVYLTVYEGDVAVSNTIRYSIESYAYAKQNDADEKLSNLVKAMIKYGDSAYEYVN